MVQGKWFPQGSDIAVPLALRREIFAKDRDALDGEAQQVVVYDGDTPVGTARLWWARGAFCLGDLGVLPQARGRGFGDLLTRLTLYKVLVHQGRRVRLTTPREAAPFFARYGFAPEDEDAPEEGMVSMGILAGDIRLDGCGGSCRGCPAD